MRGFWRFYVMLACFGLTGCGTLSEIGTAAKDAASPPKFSAMGNDMGLPSTTEYTFPPNGQPAPPRAVNALWAPGATGFFKDQRAKSIGDILTVRIKIEDKAEVSNTTNRNRTAKGESGVSALFGIETKIAKPLPGNVDPGALIGYDGSSSMTGSGAVNRSEKIDLAIAAVVKDVMPNGNLVIFGHQEVRINAELRELLISGIIRPEDISAGNEIDHTKIAEARVSYGGRGDISAFQRPKYGTRVAERVAPF